MTNLTHDDVMRGQFWNVLQFPNNLLSTDFWAGKAELGALLEAWRGLGLFRCRAARKSEREGVGVGVAPKSDCLWSSVGDVLLSSFESPHNFTVLRLRSTAECRVEVGEGGMLQGNIFWRMLIKVRVNCAECSASKPIWLSRLKAALAGSRRHKSFSWFQRVNRTTT